LQVALGKGQLCGAFAGAQLPLAQRHLQYGSGDTAPPHACRE